MLPNMSTLAEIEAAIKLLPAPQLEELAQWIVGQRAQSVAKIEPKTSVRSFFGAVHSGRKDGADNEAIDQDLTAEAARGLS